jgi:hypothetical protein
MHDPKQLIDQGIEVLMAGDRLRAREMLQAALKQDPSNERGWLALSFAVDKPEHALECVQRVLVLNPHHEKALERLADLQAGAASTAPQAQPPTKPPAPQAPPATARWATESEALNAMSEYFFLEPEAERFVRGETDRLPINGCMLLALIPFVLAGLLILTLSVAQLAQISYYRSSKWAETEGTYVGKDEIAGSNGSADYTVSFRFVVDDKVYVAEESVGQQIHDRAVDGDALRVYYRRGDPSVASTRPISGRGGPPLGLICGNLFWWAIVLGLGYYVLKPVYKQRRLAQEGTLIRGEVIHSSSYKDSDNDFRLMAEIRFRSPQTGNWIHKKYRVTRNDLAGKPLPRPGTLVHVLYIDDRTFQAL